MAKLAVHGSEAGYRAELSQGDICERCRKGHQVYDRQCRAARKGAGTKPDRFAPLDMHWTPGRTSSQQRNPAQARSEPVTAGPALRSAGGVTGSVAAPFSASAASLSDRLSDAMSAVLGGSDGGYVGEDDDSGLRAVDPDPEPAGEWAEVTDSDYVINAAGLKQIQENMGTYLSVIGMTAEMLDPYCGPILAENFNNMIERWSKVIVHYPKAAALFLDGKGGLVFAWIGAIQATWPVLMAIYDHHLAGNVKVDRASGAILRKTPGNHAQAPSFDATMPPMPDNFQYSAR